MKIYLTRWEFAEIGAGIHGWFSSTPETAAIWAYRAVAERHRRDFNRHGVIIQSAADGSHTLRNFSIESRPDGKFVLACDAPFLVTDAGSQVRAKRPSMGNSIQRATQEWLAR